MRLFDFRSLDDLDNADRPAAPACQEALHCQSGLAVDQADLLRVRPFGANVGPALYEGGRYEVRGRAENRGGREP
jgi:hypothetical protein